MKILIVGNGWLGNIIKNYLNCDITDLRIENLTSENIAGYEYVINTAAKTNIDWCEENPVSAFENNTLAAANLAKLCKSVGAKYVFISSACIFQSANETDIKYEESDPNPQCFYAFTKFWAETYIRQIDPSAMILRVRLPVSEVSHPRNSITKILNYSRVVDTQESMTVIEDFLPVLKELLDKNTSGTFHLVNEGYISPSEICTIFGHDHEIVNKQEFDAMIAQLGKAPRVTTRVGSNHLALLPNIRTRIEEIKKGWK